jgi:O-antigen/teichoic acid export membrane protein
MPSRGETLIGSGLVLALAVGLANAFNAVFQFALARILDRDEYSLLAALFVIVILASVPPLAFQATTARAVASSLSAGRRTEAGLLLRGTVHSVLVWTAALLGLTVVIVPIGATLGLAHSLALGATVATIALALVVPVAWGGLQGSERFRELSASTVLYAGARLAAGVAIGLAGGGVGAVMIGVAAATALTGFFSFFSLCGLLGETHGAARASHRLATRPNAGAAVGLTALMALATSDLLVARLSFSGGTAGDYAAASVGARVLLLVPVAVTTVLFPRVATLDDRDRERAHLLAGLTAVAAAAAVATVILWVFAEPLIELTFGAKYDAAAPWLGPLSLAMALYALVTVYLYHFLSLGRSRFALCLVGLLALQFVAYALLHETPDELIGIQIAVSAAALVVSEAWYLLRHR